MTLSTHLRIIGDVSPEGVFAKCRELIGIPQEQPLAIEPDTAWRHGEDVPTGWTLTRSEIGGFRAMLWMTVAIGREPLNRDLVLHDEEYCAEDAANGYPCAHEAGSTPPCNIEIMLDSPYGYRDGEGRDCSAWHRHLTGQLGAWLEAQGADWWAEDEFHGDWHHRLACPLDQFDRLLLEVAEDPAR